MKVSCRSSVRIALVASTPTYAMAPVVVCISIEYVREPRSISEASVPKWRAVLACRIVALFVAGIVRTAYRRVKSEEPPPACWKRALSVPSAAKVCWRWGKYRKIESMKLVILSAWLQRWKWRRYRAVPLSFSRINRKL